MLGYRGFRHWLGSGRRSANLEVIFVPPSHPLPFRTAAFGAVYALDSLHRYDLYPFGSECLRVAKPDGALLFAHLHLTNSEPDPFFERGCHQYHGRDYRAWLDQVLKDDARRGWVFSEKDLFAARAGGTLIDTPDTPHYNGDVFIGDPALSPMKVDAVDGPEVGDYLLVNPLLRLDMARSAARVDDSMRNASVGHLLDRHPVYRACLPKGERALSALDWLILCKSVTGGTVGEITGIAGAPDALDALIADEIILPVRVSAQSLAMQRFHANQLPLANGDTIIQELFKQLASSDLPALILPDGSALCGRELVQTVTGLMAAPLFAGAAILTIETPEEPLAWLAMLAALAGGREVNLTADAPSEGLLIHSRSTPPPGKALSLFGEEGGLAAQLEAGLSAGPGAPAFRAGGVATVPSLQGPVRISASALFEAAKSLRHAMREDITGIADFAGINTLLLSLAPLMRGEPARFGGSARPAA